MARPLHGNFRQVKAEFFVESRNASSPCPQHPGHFRSLTHGAFHKGRANAFAAMRLGDDHHGDIAIEEPVGQRPEKSNYFVCFHGDDGNWRSAYQVSKEL